MRRRTPDEVVQHILATAVRDEKTGCLVSSLRKDKKGYAHIRFVDELRVHVVVFFNGRLPRRRRPHILHTCDNRACVEEGHLYRGTNKQNIADKVRRDRSGKKLNIAKVRRIKAMLARGVKQSRIAKQFGVVESIISRINTGVRWAHVQDTREPGSMVVSTLESGT